MQRPFEAGKMGRDFPLHRYEGKPSDMIYDRVWYTRIRPTANFRISVKTELVFLA